MLTEAHLLREYALAWNTLDPERIVERLNPEAVYESQQVLEPLRGREAIAAYLRGKMAVIGQAPGARVRAELGRCGLEGGQPAAVFSAWPGRPCVLLFQGRGDEPRALVLLEVADGFIDRIDLCTVVPAPASALRTGLCPGLDAGPPGLPDLHSAR
jgi:hypothetical protein